MPAQIVIDLTVPESSEANVRFAVEHGMTPWLVRPVGPRTPGVPEALLAEHTEVECSSELRDWFDPRQRVCGESGTLR